MVEQGKAVPEFEAPANGDVSIKLSELKGRNVVVYFYPKDNTPGCTTEGIAFRDNYAAFQAADCDIFGVSRDSLRSHTNFVNKHEFPFKLLSDPEETLCKLFDVIKEKKMYGKTHLGIERSTFVINKEGILAKEWRKVKVKGHVEEVLEFVQTLT